jgi:hypothetical protein
MKNVIILGPGRTGSSFLAGLISHNKFYINNEQIQARRAYPDGDYENPELVDYNKKLFFSSGYDHHKIRYGRSVDISAMKNLAKGNGLEEFKAFIQKCEQNRPWLWKDPRLCYTIHFWNEFLNFNDINIIFITRDHYQIFRSYTKHQIPLTKREIYEKYDEQVSTVEDFLRTNGLKALRIHFNEFKDNTSLIDKLNQFLETEITMDDYKAIHRTNISKKESEMSFWLSYGFGLSKLKIARILRI